MKLYELATGYDDADERLTKRITELRAEVLLPGTDTAEITRRIHYLSKVRTEVRRTGELCRRYYEKGFWRDAAYTFNLSSRGNARKSFNVASGARRDQRQFLTARTPEPPESDPGRLDGATADHVVDAILAGILYGPDRKRARRKPIHGIADHGQGQ